MGRQMDSVAAPAVEHRHTKSCTMCGATIVWKRWLEKIWPELKYCGAACRRKAVTMSRLEMNAPSVSSPAA